LIVLLVVSAAGAAYLALALFALVRFARRQVPNRSETPRISVLKPLYGAEPGLYESLASVCDQDYPDFEIVFCLHDESDSATPIVTRIARDFAHLPVRIVYGENSQIVNPKIANLAKPGAEPHGDIVVLADSDIWVKRDYLRAIAASFSSERTGAVTCLYGGIPIETFAARLGAMRSEEEFSPSVLVAIALGKMEFCLGATMAVRRNVLDAIGGLEALGADLADDYNLGKLVADHGLNVELSRCTVRTTVAEKTIRALWTREVRWARTNFKLAPAGHIFSFLMYALPFAFIYAAIAQNAIAYGLLLLVAALRLALHETARATLGNGRKDDALLVPARDLFSLAVWAASLVTKTVNWRGARYRM
jgi:ceramide glucosyltransferase